MYERADLPTCGGCPFKKWHGMGETCLHRRAPTVMTTPAAKTAGEVPTGQCQGAKSWWRQRVAGLARQVLQALPLLQNP